MGGVPGNFTPVIATRQPTEWEIREQDGTFRCVSIMVVALFSTLVAKLLSAPLMPGIMRAAQVSIMTMADDAVICLT